MPDAGVAEIPEAWRSRPSEPTSRCPANAISDRTVMSVRAGDVRVGDMVSVDSPDGRRCWREAIGVFTGIDTAMRLWVTDGHTAVCIRIPGHGQRRLKIAR